MSENVSGPEGVPSDQQINDLVAGLNEMRNTLLELSLLVKDYKANIDLQSKGKTFIAANDAIGKAALKS
jgi:hypothetical protein